MEPIEIRARIKYLQQILAQKEKNLRNAHGGYLRGCKHYDGWQYYYRKDKTDKNGSYIKKDQLALARQLAQEEYDRKVCVSAEEELKFLQKAAAFYQREGEVEMLYQKLPLSHQPLVLPVKLTSQQYAEQWMQETPVISRLTEPNTEYYSDKGEHMRSKSEVLIANRLHYYHIPYQYEKPLALDQTGIVYPDFTLLDLKHRREIYWEHMGMMDDREYREQAFEKMERYERSGILLGVDLILSFETFRHPLNMSLIEVKIKRILEETQG